MNSKEIALQARAISKQLDTPEGKLEILSPVSFSLHAGDSLAITGPSGVGKSTLLSILAGLDVASAGEVLLHEHQLGKLDEEGRSRIRAEYVGFVFQSFQLLPSLTALENIMLPLEMKGHKSAKDLARNFITRVGLAQRQQHYPRQLSGGEQQRIAIARAFACQPRLLFADEPTGNLDSLTAEKITRLLFDLNRESGISLVLVTHEKHLAALCQQQLTLAAAPDSHSILDITHAGHQIIAA
ncbi:ABC transporter ATP-binding protein [Undibacterium sp. Di27W]|uniref:ABC transporter ATP-binding protein n=1 Tax=Undibacterium sp. Di27W TaxID=3413036 RepID=UPI003BF1CE42